MSAAKHQDTSAPESNEHRRHTATHRRDADQSAIADLIAVLGAAPGGLRRWSVMRAMRARSEKRSREISPKFEDDVERIFRRYCAGDSVRAGTMADPASELFYRPDDRAGEVWALNTARANAWLEGYDGLKTR